MADALSSPPIGEGIFTVVDWLELQAFFSAYGTARVDDIIAANEFQQEDAEEDVGEKDRAEDELRADIEAEVRFRSEALAGAYPFSISGDGEELLIEEDISGTRGAYLICLILSHVTNSPILNTPPNDKLVRDARKRLFQVIATLAAAGHAAGGATSLGWPREKKEQIIQVVARTVQGAGTGAARAAPHELEPTGAKDGGLDVLAWKTAPDGPPPEAFYFVQAASGNNWKGKSAKQDHEQFLHCYFEARPTCNFAFLTVCPFRLTEEEKQYQQISHGTISDRTRAPARIAEAVAAAAGGIPIDEVENLPLIDKWVSRYRREHRAAI